MSPTERALRSVATLVICAGLVWLGIWLNSLGPAFNAAMWLLAVLLFVLQLVEFVVLVWERSRKRRRKSLESANSNTRRSTTGRSGSIRS